MNDGAVRQLQTWVSGIFPQSPRSLLHYSSCTSTMSLCTQVYAPFAATKSVTTINVGTATYASDVRRRIVKNSLRLVVHNLAHFIRDSSPSSKRQPRANKQGSESIAFRVGKNYQIALLVDGNSVIPKYPEMNLTLFRRTRETT